MNFTLYKFLHIAAMFAAVTVGIGSQIVFHRIAQTRDLRVIRGVFAQAPWLERISLVLFASGVTFGLIAAALGTFNFFAPWLLTAYALIIGIGLNGSFVLGVWVKKIAAAASTEDTISPDLKQLLDDRRVFYALLADILFFVLVIYVMVTKPGGIQ